MIFDTQEKYIRLRNTVKASMPDLLPTFDPYEGITKDTDTLAAVMNDLSKALDYGKVYTRRTVTEVDDLIAFIKEVKVDDDGEEE